MEMEGLDEFQKDLLSLAQEKLPRETYKIMRKIGSKATTQVRKVARAKINNSQDKLYYKSIKRGKAFKDDTDTFVVRVFSSAPHAHLLEYGHRQVVNPGKGIGNGRGVVPGKGIGREVGFVPGQHVFSEGMKNFDDSGQYSNMISEWLDQMLDEKGL